jgi:membrane peptidoglycan carboxypeptidase
VSTPRPGPSRSRKGSRRAKSRKQPRTPRTPRERVLKALKILLIAGVVGSLVLVGTFYVAYRATDIPDANSAFQAQTTNVYYAGGKSKIGRFATQNRESIPLADVPKVMQDAVVAAEDRTFWTNNGIDPKGIIRAAFSNAKGGATQGASTITQQYVKILYLTQQRTVKRKIKEAFLSLKIQQKQSKSEILEGYLNTIYFGRGAYGVQAAANAYFGIPAKELNASQSAMLAAVLNSPNYLNPDRSDASRQALLNRYGYVVSGMESMGSISASDAAEISDKLPPLKKPTTSDLYGGQRGFMLDLVKKELGRLGFDEQEIEAGGLRVTTTFTKKAMDAAKNAVLQERPDGFSDKQLHVGVASVDVATGGLLGFYGGQDYLQSQINWAAAQDSPGSAFKPFAVAAGLKDGFSLKDTFQGNSPYTFPDGSEVVNEGEGGGTDYGAKVSLTTATQKSINTAFIDMTQAMDNGPKKIRDMAVAMGLPDKPALEANAGISLGSAPQSPIDMANAYSTIADGGLHHDWFVVSKVTRASNGEVLYTAPRKTDRVVSADITADTSYAMQQVVKAGTGVKAQRIGRPAAGKTGTATNDKGDVVTSWFVGFTPQVATAVMYVRGNGRKPLDGWLPSYFGADYPTATWAATMSALMEGLAVEDFPPPANLDGNAPSTGHDPYTPPPPKPKKTKAPKPTPTPTPTPTPAPPPQPPSTPPGQVTDTPTPTPSPVLGGPGGRNG